MKRGVPLSLAATLLLPLLSASCAATDEVVEAPSAEFVQTSPSERLMPAETVGALRVCLIQGASRLSHHAYELSFEVQATPGGTIQQVDLEHGRLDDAKIKACMLQALETMPLMSIFPIDESVASSSPAVAPSARGLLGNSVVAALPEMIHLAPIVLSASGVTVVVGVGVIVLAAAVAAEMSKECQKEWRDAARICKDLLRSPNPPHGVTGGYLDPTECARGLVSMRCGGNSVDPDGQPARPGRRT